MRTKTILKTLAVALLMPAMLLTTACSSDDNDIVNTENPANTQKGYPFPVTVNVTRQGDEGTRATYNESTSKLSFSAGDKLFVRSMGSHDKAGSFAGTLDYDAVSGKFSGTVTTEKEYKGTIVDLLENAAAFLLPAGYGSYGAYSVESGYDAQIGFDYTKAFALTKAAAVEQFSLENAFSYNSGFVLSPMNAIVNFTISGLTANKKVDVSFDTNETGVISGNVTTNATGVATFAVGVLYDKKLEDYTLTVDGNNIALPTKTTESGHIYNISRSVASVPTGALSGQFTINSNGDKVYFSKGNLYYNANATTKWYFAANQWDYIGTATGYPMDHFTWGNIDSPTYYGTSYYNYTENADLSGDTDWGSNIGTGWYTLSKDEWSYLFNTRTNAASKYGYATVAEKHGIIIVPDDFTDPMKNNGSGAFVGSTTTGWTANVYSAENWSAMETSGCVFLPAAGYRDGSTRNLAGTNGLYWSSTGNGTGYAYYVYFSSGSVNPAANNGRHAGFSVRLVRDVPAGSQGTQANDRSYGDQSDLGTW